MTIKYLLVTSLASFFLFGCGGGKSGDTIKGGLQGDWKTTCIPYQDGSALLYASHDTVDGEAFYGDGIETFTTSNCSGPPSSSVKYGGQVSYQGAINTSVCVAEKFDVEYSIVEINGEVFKGAQFDSIMSQLEQPKSKSLIACIYKDKYLEGTGNEMNVALVYDK